MSSFPQGLTPEEEESIKLAQLLQDLNSALKGLGKNQQKMYEHFSQFDAEGFSKYSEGHLRYIVDHMKMRDRNPDSRLKHINEKDRKHLELMEAQLKIMQNHMSITEKVLEATKKNEVNLRRFVSVMDTARYQEQGSGIAERYGSDMRELQDKNFGESVKDALSERSTLAGLLFGSTVRGADGKNRRILRQGKDVKGSHANVMHEKMDTIRKASGMEYDAMRDDEYAKSVGIDDYGRNKKLYTAADEAYWRDAYGYSSENSKFRRSKPSFSNTGDPFPEKEEEYAQGEGQFRGPYYEAGFTEQPLRPESLGLPEPSFIPDFEISSSQSEPLGLPEPGVMYEEPSFDSNEKEKDVPLRSSSSTEKESSFDSNEKKPFDSNEKEKDAPRSTLDTIVDSFSQEVDDILEGFKKKLDTSDSERTTQKDPPLSFNKDKKDVRERQSQPGELPTSPDLLPELNPLINKGPTSQEDKKAASPASTTNVYDGMLLGLPRWVADPPLLLNKTFKEFIDKMEAMRGDDAPGPQKDGIIDDAIDGAGQGLMNTIGAMLPKLLANPMFWKVAVGAAIVAGVTAMITASIDADKKVRRDVEESAEAQGGVSGDKARASLEMRGISTSNIRDVEKEQFRLGALEAGVTQTVRKEDAERILPRGLLPSNFSSLPDSLEVADVEAFKAQSRANKLAEAKTPAEALSGGLGFSSETMMRTLQSTGRLLQPNDYDSMRSIFTQEGKNLVQPVKIGNQTYYFASNNPKFIGEGTAKVLDPYDPNTYVTTLPALFYGLPGKPGLINREALRGVPDGGMLSFDQGGIIPGKMGAPVTFTGHAGETVIPTHKEKVRQNLDTLINNTIQTTNLSTEKMEKLLQQMIDVQNAIKDEMKRNTETTKEVSKTPASFSPPSKQFIVPTV